MFFYFNTKIKVQLERNNGNIFVKILKKNNREKTIYSIYILKSNTKKYYT